MTKSAGNPVSVSFRRQSNAREWKEKLIGFVLLCCALVSIATTVSIVIVLLNDSVFNFNAIGKDTDRPLEGLVTGTAGQLKLKGRGTKFLHDLGQLTQGDDERADGPALIHIDGVEYGVQTRESDTELTLDRPLENDVSGGTVMRVDLAQRAFFQQVSLKEFLTDREWTPQMPHRSQQKFGILPLLTNTLLVTGIAALIGVPIGLAAAIYLSEYAGPQERNIIKPILEVLAGIPTVVYGYFALMFITPWVLRPFFQDLLGFKVSFFNAASGGIVVGIMTIPMVASLSEDVLRAVPRSLREAAYALGATKFDVSMKVIVPAALSGILASFLLAIARAIGETMAVSLACGRTPNLTINPLDQIGTMTGYIVQVSQGDTPVGSLVYKSIFAIALTLFLITLTMNIISQWILKRYREAYQ
ncbi:MAG: phosphate ABC transporter permease subunit PstC [Planctomycetaceae bacterium]